MLLPFLSCFSSVVRNEVSASHARAFADAFRVHRAASSILAIVLAHCTLPALAALLPEGDYVFKSHYRNLFESSNTSGILVLWLFGGVCV